MTDLGHYLITLIDRRIKRAFESFRPRAATLEGQIPPSTLPPGGNTGDGYTPAPHDHDDRYYTKPQSDARYAPIDHTHDSLPATGGTIDGDLHVTGDISAFGDISGAAIRGTTIGATIGLFVAPAGTAIGGVDVDGKVYGTNITATPTAHAIPKARADGTLDPGWIASSTSSQRMQSIEFVSSPSPARTWLNQPAAVTELYGLIEHRRYMTLAGYTQARLQLRQGNAGASGSSLRAQYSTDNGTSWQYLDGTAGPQVATDASTALVGIRAGAWVNLAAGALIGDVMVRIVGQDGDGAADPTYGQIIMDLR